MGSAKSPNPVMLFLAVMYSDEISQKNALDECIKKFGEIDNTFGVLDVTSYTDYYSEEMGNNIKKIFLTFRTLIDRCRLPAIKNFTNTLELDFSNNGRRRVNLDPGYLTNDKLVLVTTKDFYQRIYLQDGIYAEITLHYQRGRYRHFSWTYPDYKNKEVQKFLERARSGLVGELRKLHDN